MKKKKVKYFPNDSYTGVFIRLRTVTKLRTLGQLRHRSVATLGLDLLYKLCFTLSTKIDRMLYCCQCLAKCNYRVLVRVFVCVCVFA